MGNEILSNTPEKLETFPDDREMRFNEQRATVEQIDDLARVSERADNDIVTMSMPASNETISGHDGNNFDFIRSGEEMSGVVLGNIKKIVDKEQDSPFKLSEDIQKMSDRLLGRQG